MAKLAVVIETDAPGQSFDFDSIWARQAVPPVIDETILAVAETVFELLTDERRPIVNVTEWAKREACWDTVRKARINVSEVFLATLVSRDRVAERRADAAAVQKIDSGIVAQTRVLEMGAPVWESVRQFVATRRLATPTHLGILDVATGRKRGIPSEKQSIVLLGILKTAEENGFTAG
jgi:hypothetical protein